MLAVVGVIADMVAMQITALADTPLKFMILASVLYIVLGCFARHHLDDGRHLAMSSTR